MDGMDIERAKCGALL